MTVVKICFRKRENWVDFSHEDEKDIDFFWSEVTWMHEKFDTYYFDEHVRVNHFPRFYELTRKNLLAKNLKRYQKLIKNKAEESQKSEVEIKLDFFPTTYELPDQVFNLIS